MVLKALENYIENVQQQLTSPEKTSVPGTQHNPKTSLCAVSLELLSAKEKVPLKAVRSVVCGCRISLINTVSSINEIPL